MLALLVALNSAQAGDLQYKWPTDEPLHYRIQVAMEFPYTIHMIGTANTDARIGGIGMVWLVECQAEEPQKKTQAMNCDVVRVEMAGQALARDQSDADKIIAEYEIGRAHV